MVRFGGRGLRGHVVFEIPTNVIKVQKVQKVPKGTGPNKLNLEKVQKGKLKSHCLSMVFFSQNLIKNDKEWCIRVSTYHLPKNSLQKFNTWGGILFNDVTELAVSSKKKA
ncbi:hypothetical protein BpHYR1_051849 [Brachionus plicatilis]|uniref:Uncharacterized protein n=1 Tax=Brachionus plicatilis TaxID=10195 RepID=A0A3M7SI21_BRAPC|nr:hypothetical protein BpHYR1_051849 [Brachionus plicatilis]